MDFLYVVSVNQSVWERVEYEPAWKAFEKRFGFRPGMDPKTWPAIKEPKGSITYSLEPCFDGRGTAEWARQAINYSVVWALAEVAGPGTPLIALDWQHPTYRFWPHRSESIDPSEMLSQNHTTPVPDGDYYSFMDEAITFGTFGHPWEQSLCVFGEQLRRLVDPVLGSVLPVLRSHA